MAHETDRLTTSADLQGIRLVAANLGTRIASKADVDDVEIILHSDSRSEVDTNNPEIFHFFVESSIDFIGSCADKEAERVVWIEATFQLDYRIDIGDGQPITESEIEAFGEGTAMFNAWPYLREFVQSSLIRMNLPQITLPLLRRRPAPMPMEAEDRKRA